MRFNVSWLKEFLDTKHDAEAIALRLTATGLEVEGVLQGTALIERLRSEGAAEDVISALKDDTLIEVNVTANRPDYAGVYGIARDLAAAGMGTLRPLSQVGYGVLGGELGKSIAQALESANSPSTKQVTSGLPATASAHCSHFIGRTISGLANDKVTPVAIRARLAAVGARSINRLVDVTNYFCFGFCRPLHVFDADKVVGLISVRHTKAQEKFTGLDGKEYVLPEGLTAIADEAGVIALAGVLGGERTGCSESTKNVVLETAFFDPTQTTKAGRALGIVSAARYRFERGVDPAFLETADTLATGFIVALCGGTPSATTGFGGAFGRAAFSYRPSDVHRILGINVAEAKQREIFTALGCVVSNLDSTGCMQVTPPSWRGDLTQGRDLVEEIARIIGFDAIPTEQFFAERALSGHGTISPVQSAQFIAQHTLAEIGYNGSVTWAFMQESHASAFATTHDALRLVNPISAELNYLRPTAIANLMRAALTNHARSVSSVALSEVGPAFFVAHGAVAQELRAVGVRSGTAGERVWYEPSRPVDAFDVKGDLFALLADLGLADEHRIELRTNAASPYFHPGLSAQVVYDGVVVAQFGMIHPKVCQTLEFEFACAAFEVFLDAVATVPAAKQAEFEKVDTQIVERDAAFLLNVSVTAQALEQCTRNAVSSIALKMSLPLARSSARVFDRYRGKGIEPGKKSMAVTMRVQPRAGHALEADQIERLVQGVIAQVGSELGGVLRK